MALLAAAWLEPCAAAQSPEQPAVIAPADAPPTDSSAARMLTIPLIRAGARLAPADLAAARERVALGLTSLPWEGLALSHGDPAIPTRQVAP